MKLAVACDHGGFELKTELIAHLLEKGYTIKDFGCYDTNSIDYADYAFPACEAVARGEFDRGILICTTGVGMSICANKVAGIRCGLCTNLFMAEMNRKHNNGNVLALGAKVVEPALAKQITDIWLTTEFDGGRHQRRIDKISEYERSH